jgi:hypothetical protein
MKFKNLIIVFLILFFSLNAFALTYRTDLNNGSWSDYNTGLASYFYAPDNSQSTYNRDFSDNFSITSSGQCVENWCATASNIANYNYVKVTDNNLLQLWSRNYINPVLVFATTEIINDTLVSFDFNAELGRYGTCPKGQDCASHFYYGYVDDSNNFTSVGQYNGVYEYNTTIPWTNVSYKIPSGVGKYRVAFLFRGGTLDSYAWIDNIIVSRNNVGTFFKGSTAPYCSNISNCSNVSSASDLKSNATRDLYWVLDYVSSQSSVCAVSENGVSQGNATNIGNGMYYYKIKSKAFPSNDVNVVLSAICTASSYQNKGFFVEAQIFNDSNIQTTLTATNTLNDNEGFRGDIVTFYSSFKDDLGSIITDGNCTLTIDGSTNAMTYNSSLGKYVYTKGFVTDGIYPTTHSCTKGNYQSQSSSYSINIGTPLQEILTFTPLTNISSYDLLDSNVTMLNNTTTDITFKAVGSETGNAKFVWTNPDRTKNYLIYTSTDGENWTFNDSLTFGSTAYNGLQKIYYSNTYNYSFTDTITTTPKYYKLEIQTPALQWATIRNSSDWIKVSKASTYTDINSITWDLFNNSNLSPLNIYTSENFPTLTSTSLTGGYIVRFTAYAENIDSTATLSYGSKGNEASSIVLTTTPTTYNLPITTSELQISLKGTTSEVYQIYISDVVIIPRAYFISSATLWTQTGGILPSIVSGNTSSQYIQETTPFLMKTKAYNTSGLIKSIRTDVISYTDSNAIIKSYYWDLKDSIANTSIILNKLLEGVVDYSNSNKDQNPNEALKQIYVKNTLIDSNGRSVAEQTSNIGFLQYPFFANDISLILQNIKAKVGQSPKFNFSIQQKNIDALIGIQFSIYEKSSNVSYTDSPVFSKIYSPSELGCSSLFDCSKIITLDEYSFEDTGNYSILANLILTTQDKNEIWADNGFLASPLMSSYLLPIYPSYSTFETARIFQVFERTNHQYKPTETIPVVVQLRNDELTNMKSDYLVRLKTMDSELNVGAIEYQPSKFVYDEVTGYNYWFFNNLWFNTAGTGLISDTNSVTPIAYIQSLKQTTASYETPAFLTDKCTSYPLDFDLNFNLGSFIMSWIGLDPKYKCQTDAPAVVLAEDAQYLDFNSNYVPKAEQNQSIFCLRTDANRTYNTALGDEVVCGVIYRKSEEQIDKFGVTIGNAYSDYSKKGNEAQYINFEIPQEQIMFNDILMMKASLDASYTTDRIDTLGELLTAGFNKILPNFQGGVDFIQDNLVNTNLLNLNAGADVNLSEQLNPNLVSGIFFFKINGLQVTNMNDYVKQYPELKTLAPENFRSWALQNGLELPKKKTLIQIYSSDMKQNQAIELESPLIIYENPSKTTQIDENNYSVIPTNLKFNFIVDMTSGNFMKTMRGYVPLNFSYVVPPAPFNPMEFVNDLLFGTDEQGNPQGIFNNPPKFFFNNWFIFLIIGIVILWLSVVIKNFLGGGNNTNINIRK